MLLQHFDKFDYIAVYDVSSRNYEEFRRSQCPRPISDAAAGHYSCVGGHLIVVYRYMETLTLQIDGAKWDFDDHISIEIEPCNTLNSIVVKRDGVILLSGTYEAPCAFTPHQFDATPFAAPEDFDFAQYIANLSRDPARRDRIYRNVKLGQ
jgi:hypothetical protein